MKDKIKSLIAEKEAFETRRDQLQKEAKLITLELKAEEKKIKAVQELIDSINADTEQEKGQPANP
jgi:hypothetical protein